VVVIEDAARLDGIEPIRSRHRPGHVEQPIEIRAQHLIFR
jgi:hypothetical protein